MGSPHLRGYLSGDFGFRSRLENDAPAILAELQALPRDVFRPWPQDDAYTGGWYVFGLYVEGQRLDHNCDLMPRTAAALATVPGIRSAGFSALLPHSQLPPHNGPVTEFLRCHLGLIIPPETGITVSGIERRWEFGRTLVFDHNEEHRAWNLSDQVRVILLLDFKRPDELMPDEPEVVGPDPKMRAMAHQFFADWGIAEST